MRCRARGDLPLKPVPEVNSSHDICVERVHKLADAMVKEPVSNGRVVRNCLAATGTAVFLVWTDEASQLGPLAISSTVSEEHSGHSQSVHNGDQPAPLLEPELAGPSKAAGKVHTLWVKNSPSWPTMSRRSSSVRRASSGCWLM